MDRIRRRHVASTVLALCLALESVSAVAAVAGGVVTARHSAAHALPAAAPAGEVLAEAGTADHGWAVEPAAAPAQITPPDAPDYAKPKTAVPAPTAAPAAVKPATVKAAPRATAKSTPKPTVRAATTTPKPKTTSAPRAVTYSGRNHVWIPSLGVNRSVSFFPCDRAAPPDNLVYRWGCAGANNVYLMGHAGGVFRPLHDAYLNGRLKVGLRVWYADGSGTVHVFAVQWWRLVRPTGDVAWAWAAQSTPSMTLQTCMGANSEYRLIVRLVQVG